MLGRFTGQTKLSECVSRCKKMGVENPESFCAKLADEMSKLGD